MYVTEAYHLIQQPYSSAGKERLAFLLNKMITDNFESLVQLLYRVDVPEKEVKLLLQQPHTDAGHLLAGILLERQQQKATWRKRFSTNNDIPEEDRW